MINLYKKVKNKLSKADTLNLGEPCEWSDIKVGEVFGFNGCFSVLHKTTNGSVTLLDTDDKFTHEFIGEIIPVTVLGDNNFQIDYSIFRAQFVDLTPFGLVGGLSGNTYRLPQETQDLYLVPLDGD